MTKQTKKVEPITPEPITAEALEKEGFIRVSSEGSNPKIFMYGDIFIDVYAIIPPKVWIKKTKARNVTTMPDLRKLIHLIGK